MFSEKQLRYHSLYMDIAQRVSEMSYAKRLKVGAIIEKDGRIISTGWNGMPAGMDNNCEHEIVTGNGTYDHVQLVTRSEVMHAERNAIDKLASSNESSKDATLYITHSPCLECAKSIYTSGVKTVLYKNLYRSSEGVKFLQAMNVSVIHFEGKENANNGI